MISKTIYLYVKTHRKTGLKYLGKTVNPKPDKYQGSGKYWRNHIAKHGYNVETEILFSSVDKEEFKKVSLYYSELYDVVNSNEWANLVCECGDGGDTSCSQAYKDYIKNVTVVKDNGLSRAQEIAAKGKLTCSTVKDADGLTAYQRLGNKASARQNDKHWRETTMKKSLEKIAKRKDTNIDENGFNSHKRSGVKSAQSRKSHINEEGLNIDQVSGKKISRRKNEISWKETIGVATIQKFKNTMSSPEYKDIVKQIGPKISATRKSKEWIESNTHVCPYCNLSIVGKGNFNRWHNDKCKHSS